MEYPISWVIIILLTQIPSHSTIATYQENERTYRRHINSTYVNYWETGLKEATYRTFLRKGYADPSLKDQILNAPLVGLHNQQASPFGDIAILGRGQLYFSAGGFLFVQDEYSYDCDECSVRRQSHLNHGQIIAFWTVTRLRHHDKTGFYRYETEYLISPINNSHYLKRNGAFNYDIPGFVFILKTNQPEVNGFKNYVKPTVAWYNEGKSNYLNSKESRRYLPPDTTTTAFYYTTPKTFYPNIKDRNHYYDPDIVPARNNVEKEIELYNKLLQSLKYAQTSTSSTLLPTNKTPTTGYYSVNKATPPIPLTTTTAKTFATSIRFPNITPFKPSPMYTKYSEPDPLYTTTTPSVTNTPYKKPIVDTTTTSIFYPKPTQTTLITPLTTTSSPDRVSPSEVNYSNMIFNPEHILTNDRKATTAVPVSKPIPITLSSLLTSKASNGIPSTEIPHSSNTNTHHMLTSTSKPKLQSTEGQFAHTESYSTSVSGNTNKISLAAEPSSSAQTDSNINFFSTSTPTSSTTMTTTTKKKLMLTTSSRFNIFSIFDKPNQRKEIEMSTVTNIKEPTNIITSQTSSPVILTLTTPSYAETNQASSIMFSIVRNNTPTIGPSSNDIIENKSIDSNLHSKEISITVEMPTSASVTQPTSRVSDIGERGSKKKLIANELLKKVDENIPTSKSFEETTLKEMFTTDTTPIKTLIQTETTEALSDTTAIPLNSTPNDKIYKDITTKNILEYVTIRDTAPRETIVTTYEEPQNTEKLTVVPTTEQNMLKTITPITTKLIELNLTQKAQMPTKVISTLNTTPRIRKYQYTKIPRRKTNNSRKIDIASSRSPAIYRTKEPGIHTTGLKLDLFTNTHVQPTQKLTITPYTKKIQITNTVKGSQDVTTEPIKDESTASTTVSLQLLEEPTTYATTYRNMDVMTETITQIPSILENGSSSNNLTDHHLKETSKNTMVKETTTPMSTTIITTPTSVEIFDELFGAYSRELPTIEPPITKKTNKNVANDKELEEELFGIISRSSNSIENIERPTQIEESTTEIESTPKIIFDNFYEASTLLTPVEDDFEIVTNNEEITTIKSDTILMTTSKNTNSDEDETTLITITTEAPIQNTTQPEKLTTECNLTKTTKRSNQENAEITKIIMIHIVNDTKIQEMQNRDHDTLKANVTKINVGDDNFYIYKAIVDEKEISPQMRKEEADLFHQLALSVVNNAKSIDYLSKRKRTRKKKVVKQKIRRKDKQRTKN